MGQAKRRGTFQQRQDAAMLIAKEKAEALHAARVEQRGLHPDDIKYNQRFGGALGALMFTVAMASQFPGVEPCKPKRNK